MKLRLTQLQHAVEGRRVMQSVGDYQDPAAGFPVTDQAILQRGGADRIQMGCRLIEDKKAGRRQKDPGRSNPSSLATRNS